MKLSRLKNHMITRAVVFGVAVLGILSFFPPHGQTVAKAGETGISQNVQWDSAGDSMDLSVLVSPEYKKYEIYYTKGMAPEITFVSPDGTKQTSAKDDIQCDIISLHHNPNLGVDGYTDFSMESIYVKSDSEPGVWTMHVQKDIGCRELFVVEAEVEDGWENLKCDYATQPTLFISWYIGEGSSVTNEEVTDIIKKGSVPEINNIHSGTTKKDDREVPQPSVLDQLMPLIMGILVVGGTGGAGFFLYRKQQQKKRLQEEKENRKKAANAKVRAMKAKENELLDELDGSFNDYDEFDDEFGERADEPEEPHRKEEMEENIVEPEETMPEQTPRKPSVKKQKEKAGENEYHPQIPTSEVQQNIPQMQTAQIRAGNVPQPGYPQMMPQQGQFTDGQPQGAVYMTGYPQNIQVNRNMGVPAGNVPQPGYPQTTPQQQAVAAPGVSSGYGQFSTSSSMAGFPQRETNPSGSAVFPQTGNGMPRAGVVIPNAGVVQENEDEDYF